MKIAIYARVSTQQQAQDQTIEQQVQRLRDHLQGRGEELLEDHIFRDDGVSGATLDRPGLNELRDQVANGELDRVLITCPDRLARNFVHQQLLLEEFRKYHCEIEFLDHPMSADPHDQLVLQIRGAVAEYERTLIRDRMRRGRLAKLKAGSLLPWNKPPYGYQADPDHPRDPKGITIDEAKAAVVKEIFTHYAEECCSLYAVVKYLHEADIPSPSGKAFWNTASVRNILVNPAYTGNVFAYRAHATKVVKRHSALHPVGKRDKIYLPAPPENWLFVTTIPAIIPQELFDLAKARLSHNQMFAQRHNTTHLYLLRNLVSCGYCHRSCMGREVHPGYRYYVCQRKQSVLSNRGLPRCQAHYIPTAYLDQLVWDDLCHLITHPDLIADAFQDLHNSPGLSQDFLSRSEILAKRRKALQSQLERLTDAYLNSVIPLAEYQRRRADIEKNLSAIENQEKTLSIQINRREELLSKFSSVSQFCQRIQAGLDLASFEQKRSLVELLVDHVIVFDDQVEIRYVIPLSHASESIRFCHLRKDYFRDPSRSKGFTASQQGAQY